jgi:hypothetical protein
MGVTTSEVGYASVTTGKGDNEVHKGHVVVLKKTENHTYVRTCTQPVIKIFSLLKNILAYLGYPPASPFFLMLRCSLMMMTVI